FEPLLLADLPERLDGGSRYRFRLKDGVRFHDNPCFPGGKGREVVADDVFYSLKRIADRDNGLKNWWLLDDQIVGLEPQPPGETFDYAAPVEGLVKRSDKEFEIVLNRPVHRFLWVLAMFQTSVLPREAVEYYGENFSRNPVGTGPFILDSWAPKQHIHFKRNPNYHECYYPEESKWSAEDREAGLHEAAGQRLPMVDRLEFTMYVPDQPVWLEFQQGKLGYIELPFPFFTEAFSRRSKRMDRELRQKGVTYRAEPQLDMIFRAFNMDDPLLGGYSEEKIALRRAITLAIDLDEFNETFYEGLCVHYDGPIPPRMDGHPAEGRAPGAPRGPDIERARAELARAGYPGGEGLPPLKFYTSEGGSNQQQTDMLRRQLARIDVELDAQLVDFSQLSELVNKRQAPMFGFAWLSDYPDAENNLALFYSPNASPGSNHWNYSRPEFDEMYKRAIVMEPGPERTALYEQMRDMVIADCVIIGSLARTRYYLIQPWLKNARPTNTFHAWFKYLDIDESRR
ncbi:MAG: ABC transporter substrate-binding protein, partial [Phycisphaerales bacterium JB039]